MELRLILKPDQNHLDDLPSFFAFAQRAFWAAEILARLAALILDFFFGAGAAAGAAPRMETSSFSSLLILSFKSAARLSWADVRDNRLLIELLV